MYRSSFSASFRFCSVIREASCSFFWENEKRKVSLKTSAEG